MLRHPIASPLPGTFYRRPEPGSAPYVDVGARVSVGDVIGLVEVMKQFCEIHAEAAGTIVSIDIADGAAVEAGQTLMMLVDGR